MIEPFLPKVLLKKMSIAAPTRHPKFHVPTTAPPIWGMKSLGYAFSKAGMRTIPPMSPWP